jgi:hypothetical protein
MKRCPTCSAVYHDPELNFCLNDGTRLDAQPAMANESDETALMHHAGATSAPPLFTQHQHSGGRDAEQGKGSSATLKFLALLGVFGIIFIVLAGAGAAAFLYFDGMSLLRDEKPRHEPPRPKPPPDERKGPQRPLDEQLADLERKIEERKDSAGSEEVELPVDLMDPRPATVNSPVDGFLALRSLPSTEIGKRIAKIPHGETITIGLCVDTGKVGGKAGNWCMARYGDKTGWVFDAFLVIEE